MGQVPLQRALPLAAERGLVTPLTSAQHPGRSHNKQRGKGLDPHRSPAQPRRESAEATWQSAGAPAPGSSLGSSPQKLPSWPLQGPCALGQPPRRPPVPAPGVPVPATARSPRPYLQARTLAHASGLAPPAWPPPSHCQEPSTCPRPSCLSWQNPQILPRLKPRSRRGQEEPRAVYTLETQQQKLQALLGPGEGEAGKPGSP